VKNVEAAQGDFPGGIGPAECVNVEHEEVVLMPLWVKAKRVTFKYGLGAEFIDVLKTLHKLGLDKTEAVNVKGVQVPSPMTMAHPWGLTECQHLVELWLNFDLAL
jgi:saccharopine dehydrogenase-like NADP-dependent oxidoreductase